MMATGMGQLVGQFLLDRDGVVRWTSTEVLDGGLFGAPNTAGADVGSVANRKLRRSFGSAGGAQLVAVI